MPQTPERDAAVPFDASLPGRARAVIAEAAAIAKPFFHEGRQTRAQVWSKAGGSPVTEADVAVDTFLKDRLSALEPRAAWLSEETSDDAARLDAEWVWIVDPIDGTRAFVAGHRDWSIAVALLHHGQPVLGFVHGPALDVAYEAVIGAGATCNGRPIAVSGRAELDGAGVSGPKPLFERLTRGCARSGAGRMNHLERIPSLALRVVRVAEGAIDLGLVMKGSRDWDLAAADLILREAGGAVVDLGGLPARYNRAQPVHGELLAVPQSLRAPALAAFAATA